MVSTRTRRKMLFVSFLLFPVVYNYLSPVLMIQGAAEKVVTASLIYWIAYFVVSLFIGRAACSHICPFGAVQTIVDAVIGQKYRKYRRLSIIRYVLFTAWIGGFLWVALSSGGFRAVVPQYNTENIVSVDGVAGLIRYYVLMGIPLLFAGLFGRMGFCHYVCPFGVLDILGSKLAKALRLPTLHLKLDAAKCSDCRQCDKICPMNNPVSEFVKSHEVRLETCKLCGECCSVCKTGAVSRCFGVRQ